MEHPDRVVTPRSRGADNARGRRLKGRAEALPGVLLLIEQVTMESWECYLRSSQSAIHANPKSPIQSSIKI